MAITWRIKSLGSRKWTKNMLDVVFCTNRPLTARFDDSIYGFDYYYVFILFFVGDWECLHDKLANLLEKKKRILIFYSASPNLERAIIVRPLYATFHFDWEKSICRWWSSVMTAHRVLHKYCPLIRAVSLDRVCSPVKVQIDRKIHSDPFLPAPSLQKLHCL